MAKGGPLELLDVESPIDEAALLEIARGQLEDGVLSASRAVVAQIQRDLARSLNA